MAFQIPIRVYIEDTDAGGIVFYANYLKFFERARTDFLRSLGIAQSVTIAENLIFVVRRAEIEYCAPARLDDLLNVSCRLTEFRRTRIGFTQEAIREDTGEILVKAEVEVVCVRMDTLKPKMMPKGIVSELEKNIEGQNV
ncbi:tol-pal system-associated acyl-CoA thioesterase [Litorivicinus sp.]|jgi:acyl-CoA thioester hydrolase|nr:tol-pal system-associated acyl-CoA thioesterase [Litorivicinus sp.]|tara:strand:- start:1499 stop:1918 length:420 start_codon:yes stop_codon:yes gene_type:complete